METDIVKYPADDLEEGELSDGSDEVYTPLQRPDTKPLHASDAPMASAGSTSASRMDEAEDTSSELGLSSDDSSSGSDEGVKRLARGEEKKTKKKRPIAQLRVRPIATMQNARPKKYNVWSESLQEESLMENMRGFDVTKDMKSDRSVETYDFSIKYRLNGENRLKRRAGGGNYSDEDYYQSSKRSRQERRSVKDRLGSRKSSSSSGDNAPRHILNLDVQEGASDEVVARDIANKLYEEKDDLLLRVVQVLGQKEAIEFFKETQHIERDGGMMIMNGQRRRTPGGVFLFLIKTDMKISEDDKKSIFREDTRKATNERKVIQACRREQKVEELKKRLNLQDKELQPLSSRSEIMPGNKHHLKPDTNGTLSNPPPSPVTNSGQENSPDYSAHAINHVNHDSSPEKIVARTLNDLDDESLSAYDDDVLDMNCDDMDLF